MKGLKIIILIALLTACNLGFSTTDSPSKSHRWFISAGASRTSFHTPDFILPISLGAGVPNVSYPSKTAPGIKTSTKAFSPNMTIGYYLTHPLFLSSIFGSKTSLQFHFSNYSADGSAEMNLHDALGYIWANSGGVDGKSPSKPINKDGAIELQNASLNYKTSLLQLQVSYIGDKQLGNSAFSLHPLLGITYSHLKQDYHYNINAEEPDKTRTYKSTGNDNITSSQFGITLGNTLNYAITRALSLGLVTNLSLLYISSKLTDIQTPFVNAAKPAFSSPITTNVSASTISFQAKAALALSYLISKTIGISLQGGINILGYIPDVVTRTSSSSSIVHLQGKTKANPFVGLNAIIHL